MSGTDPLNPMSPFCFSFRAYWSFNGSIDPFRLSRESPGLNMASYCMFSGSMLPDALRPLLFSLNLAKPGS